MNKINKNVADIKKELKENIAISERFVARAESSFLIQLNKKKCADLILNSPLEEENIAEILIGLHIILEVGLSALYRTLIPASTKFSLGHEEAVKAVDRVNFIDKTRLFLFNSEFDFEGQEEKAKEYSIIIKKMMNFSEVRNKLLHGYSIYTIFNGKENIKSELRKQLTLENLKIQEKNFIYIIEGMRFYIDHLKSPLTKEGRESVKNGYLDHNFLPILRIN